MFASTGESLLKAILATPADNLPRLVYADWLEEEGSEELANFIRLQCRTPFATLQNKVYEIASEQQERLAILNHGERWAKHATPTGTVSGNFGAFDKLAGQKYGMLCRLPAGDVFRDENGKPHLHTFDLSDVLHWIANTIYWRFSFPLDTDDNFWGRMITKDRLDKSGIAFTRGFPSHWRGKCLDWFTKVGRSAVQNYPIERVEFCDAFEVFRGRTLRINFDLFDRYPSINGSRREVEIESVAALQNEFSQLAISSVS